ncbi:MAG: TPM domain-containing protein [Clostridia bacterium]|nr:TPM domain-containing protein [Clostridia bacterium]
MKKSILMLAVLLLLPAVLLTIPAAAEDQRVIFDNGGFLNTDTEEELTALALEKAEETGCDFYIVTHEMRHEDDEYWGEDFLEDEGLSENADIIILIITLDDGTYYYDLYLYGDAWDKVPKRERNYLLDHDEVYDNLKGGRLKAGIIAFLNVGAELYEGENAGYEAYEKSFRVKLLIFSLIIAAVLAFVACFGVYKSYTAKKKSVDYPLEHFAKMDLKDKEDIFAGSFVTRRVIQTNSGGGGGGRGGGGGHGGGR